VVGRSGPCYGPRPSGFQVDRTPSRANGPFSPGLAGLWDFEDFESFAAASPGWDQRHQQLGSGTSTVRLALAQSGNVQLAVVRRAAGVRVEGVPPVDSITFGVVLGGEVRVDGELYGPGWVACIRGGKPIEVHAPASSVTLTMCVDKGLFDRLACESPDALGDGGPLLLRDESARRSLVATWCRWIKRARRDVSWLTDPGRAGVLEDAAVSVLLRCLDQRRPQRLAQPSRRSVREAEETIRARLRDPLAVQELADSLGMSRRTLHAGFVRQYGVSPKAYHQALRLDAVRSELRRALPGARVGDVARRWSFLHLGRFSVDYRRAFGESPSATLRRALRSRG